MRAVLQLLIGVCQASLSCLRVPLAAKARREGGRSLLSLDIGASVVQVDMDSRSLGAPGDGLAALLQPGIGDAHTQRAIFAWLRTLVKGSALAALLQVEGG